ncbi:HD domain-containing protein [bacterium]|nr:HD domain-containing protein [bacterium]
MRVFSGLSTVLDLAHPELIHHHKVVAYISLNVAREMNLEPSAQEELFLAALIHDLGILSLRESRDIYQIEAIDPHRHAFIAYTLLNEVPFIKKRVPNIANIILYHHAPWQAMENPAIRTALLKAITRYTKVDISITSYILSLADKVSLLIQPDKFILHQVDCIRDRIEQISGTLLPKEAVEAFLEISRKESFWLALTPSYIEDFVAKEIAKTSLISVGEDDFLELSRFICDIVDLHSPFTAIHSHGVSAVAEKIGELLGFSGEELRSLRIAGYLHDLGKIAVPEDVLEKNDKLTSEEFAVVKAHPFHTYMAIMEMGGCGEVLNWASFHHENLDGSGYPFHLREEELDLGARIMRVADVFSSLREYRPYRSVMARPDILSILRKMADDRAIDGNIVSVIEKHYEEIDAVFLQEQFTNHQRYQRLWREIAFVTMS